MDDTIVAISFLAGYIPILLYLLVRVQSKKVDEKVVYAIYGVCSLFIIPAILLWIYLYNENHGNISVIIVPVTGLLGIISLWLTQKILDIRSQSLTWIQYLKWVYYISVPFGILSLIYAFGFSILFVLQIFFAETLQGYWVESVRGFIFGLMLYLYSTIGAYTFGHGLTKIVKIWLWRIQAISEHPDYYLDGTPRKLREKTNFTLVWFIRLGGYGYLLSLTFVSLLIWPTTQGLMG